MRRTILDQLLAWKNQSRRKPLIVRGARQVGKTWSLIDFGESHFKGTTHVVDLEKRQEWHRIFDGDLDVQRILSELEILLNDRIVPGRDLLFFDEIQSCPRAIMALRYLYEECPELHVVAAGSLLEFAMRDISFPVGRVQFLNMFPMSFVEFLQAIGRDVAAETVLEPPHRVADGIHAMLIGELRRYMFVGGMPECVATFAETGRLRNAFDVQAELVDAYRHDFSKYAPYSDKRCLNSVLSSVARHVGKQIKYSRLAEGFSNPTIKKAFDLLCLSQINPRVSATRPSGLPLGASATERKFKAIMVDIGLMQHLSGLPVDVEFPRTDLLGIHQGAMAEQFVGQELMAAGQPDQYYWARRAKSSSAEVDYLIMLQGMIHPVEVKSGAAGRLRSLHMLLQQYPNCPAGYVFSCSNYAELPKQRLVFLPLYHVYSLVTNRGEIEGIPATETEI